MKNILTNKSQQQGVAMIFYLFFLMLIMLVVGGGMTYVSGTVHAQNRRSDWVAAQEYAQGGAVIACDEMNQAFTRTTGTMAQALAAKGYVADTALTNAQNSVYKRTISAPFTNQTVQAQLWIPAGNAPKTAKIVATAKKGKVTQSTTLNLRFTWGYPAAIISTHPGTNTTAWDSGAGKAGNVALDGAALGPLIVDGGDTKAILANGRVNIDTAIAAMPAESVSARNFGTSNQIPDYTAQGTANALFDFNRFVAVADSTPNAHNTDGGTNHFPSLASFLKANAKAAATSAGALEGVIVVDVTQTDKSKDVGIDVLANPQNYVGTAYLPASNPQTKGISVKGTLFFKFGPAYGPLNKIFNRMAMNINPANMTGFTPGNSSTYKSGYPATYSDPAKNPININITSKGFTNFTADEDLPAVMYSIGTVDMHGPVNISGVVYTPSYSEIENRPNEGFKVANQTQYIKGSIIVGMGLFYQNTQAAKSVVSYDPNAVDSLATMGGAGKKVSVGFWE
jgi:hypothetical protein